MLVVKHSQTPLSGNRRQAAKKKVTKTGSRERPHVIKIPGMRKLIAVLLVAIPAFAQVSVGNYTLTANSSTVNLPVPNTVIDMGSGATANGNIGAVAVRFSNAECTGAAFEVKFFRRSGNTFTMTAERGPFPVTSSLTAVALTPSVPVLAGDLIGITTLRDCARTVGQMPLLFRSAVHFAGDITSGTIDASTSQLTSFALSAYGAPSLESEVRTQVILAAGATGGIGGASFKTDALLGNLRSNRSQGRLVYHPAGISGTTSDPSVAFGIDPQLTTAFSNFVANHLHINGVGSVDVYTRIGYEAPTASVRIYDDAGAGGTKGFTLDALSLDAALQPFENALLFAPQDPARFRMNIGIRTLEANEIQFLHLGPDGSLRAFVKKNYPADYFTQGSAASFTGVTPASGDSIIVYSQQKAFFAYSSIIDNTTNDPSVQVAKHLK